MRHVHAVKEREMKEKEKKGEVGNGGERKKYKNNLNIYLSSL
jgi:hypothetical protein